MLPLFMCMLLTLYCISPLSPWKGCLMNLSWWRWWRWLTRMGKVDRQWHSSDTNPPALRSACTEQLVASPAHKEEPDYDWKTCQHSAAEIIRYKYGCKNRNDATQVQRPLCITSSLKWINSFWKHHLLFIVLCLCCSKCKHMHIHPLVQMCMVYCTCSLTAYNPNLTFIWVPPSDWILTQTTKTQTLFHIQIPARWTKLHSKNVVHRHVLNIKCYAIFVSFICYLCCKAASCQLINTN